MCIRDRHVIEVELRRLLEDRSNARCADCGSGLLIKEKRWGRIYVSIDNGVFICSSCAEIHNALDVELYLVKPIILTKLGEIPYLDTGGNRKFHEFMQTYNLNIPDIRSKYKSRAAEYYRLQLKAIIERKLFTQIPPNYENGQKSIEMPKEEAKASNEGSSASYYLMMGINKLREKAKEASEALKDINFTDTLKSTGLTLKDPCTLRCYLSLIHICRCRRYAVCRSRWSPYH
eukprot:TRINITY_DN12459_c0_g1_i3.p1 TRINITY_DN12459_c0_g1~~TRINITY_DN12459_c0_g1_i3.p1  ORF type:complete len:232 (+),score=41.52 TRINITY_DN12459_c0_g1_i3:72-767(+)